MIVDDGVQGLAISVDCTCDSWTLRFAPRFSFQLDITPGGATIKHHDSSWMAYFERGKLPWQMTTNERRCQLRI